MNKTHSTRGVLNQDWTLVKMVGLVTAAFGLAGCGESEEPSDPASMDSEESLLYLVSGGFLGDSPTSYASLVESLDADTEVDLQAGLSVPSIPRISPGAERGVFFVGLRESPIVQRYRVTDDRQFVLEDEVSFQPSGLTSAAAGRFQVIDAEKAYYIDTASLTVVVWNPETMTRVNDFFLDGLPEAGLQTRDLIIDRDGDRVVIGTDYVRPDGTSARLGRLAIIDSTTDAVTYTSQTSCGYLGWSARDQEGHLYYASHPGQAGQVAAGVAGNPASRPCMVRKLAGADEFDPDYLIDFEALTGAPTGAVIQGARGHAYLLVFNQDLVTITADNADQAVSLPAWQVYSVVLGREFDTLTRVPGLEPARGLGVSTIVEVGENDLSTPFLVRVTGDGSSGTFVDVSDPMAFRNAITVPGVPGPILRIR